VGRVVEGSAYLSSRREIAVIAPSAPAVAPPAGDLSATP
jgi:hypothetical protein